MISLINEQRKLYSIRIVEYSVEGAMYLWMQNEKLGFA